MREAYLPTGVRLLARIFLAVLAVGSLVLALLIRMGVL